VFESIYFLQTFRGINAVLSERHYHLFFSVPETVREVESVLAKSDGVIVFGIHGEDRMNSIFEGGFRTSARFPRVFIKSRDRGERPLVTIDNREGGRVAASHLLDLGHRRIAYLGAGEGDDEGGRRIMGGREAVLERGSPGVFHLYSYGRSDMEATMERFFNERELRGITAVFCWSDRDARVLVYECRLRGIRVPEDLSVIGFDDRPAYTTMVHPYLTTVRQPFDDLGKVAAEQIFRLMENGNAEPQEWDECVQIKPKLVARETCSPPS
jgi:DNA-binding LacI/PurR family transcriptional regulator